MKRIAVALALAAALGLYVGLSSADSYAVGKVALKGAVLEYDGLAITAKGSASLLSLAPDSPIEAGTMRLESLDAESIRLDLTRDKNRELAVEKAAATGGVILKARRADKETTQAGAVVTVVRGLRATGQTATLVQGQDVVVLKGDVIVRVTEPGTAEPIAVLTGDTATVSLKENKIRIEGSSGRPAEFVVTPKEEEKT